MIALHPHLLLSIKIQFGTTDLCYAPFLTIIAMFHQAGSTTQDSVPRETALAQKHLQKLDKKHIFQIAVEEKKEGAETILRSVLCRDDLVLSQTGYTVLHIPKS